MLHSSSVEKEGQTVATLVENDVKILVVEDEAIIAMDIQGLLKKMGYADSEVVFSGEESIEKVAARRPHLVLMDIKLKGSLDGIQAAKHIFYEYQIPVVYITAFGDENTIKRANGTARFGYITKPFEEADLKSAIQKALYKAHN